MLSILTAIFGFLGPIISGPLFNTLAAAYKAKLDAGNNAETIAANLAIQQAAINVQQQQLQNQLIVAEQGRWWTAFPKFLIELAVSIYVFVIVLDKIFKWHATDLPGDTLTTVIQIALVGMFGSYTAIGAVKQWVAPRRGTKA
jgi:hypothetical protein